jgi:hypothetical protein
MNTATPPTLAERLMNVPTGRLAVRLSLAQAAFARAQSSLPRLRAMEEIEAVRREMIRRGFKVAE